MRHIRPRSAYDVLALLSFFLVIGGGTALASYLVSSNSQVGPGTISGHHPPSGKHSNLITGSVNAQDLATGAVTGSRLANASVTTSKLSLPKMSFSGTDSEPNDGTPHHTVLNLDGLQLGVTCTTEAPSNTVLQLYVTDAAGGTLRGSWSEGQLGSSSPKLANNLVSSTPTLAASTSSSASPTELAGEFTYANSNRVIGILVDGSANRVSDGCDMHGTAVPAPN